MLKTIFVSAAVIVKLSSLSLVILNDVSFEFSEFHQEAITSFGALVSKSSVIIKWFMDLYLIREIAVSFNFGLPPTDIISFSAIDMPNFENKA